MYYDEAIFLNGAVHLLGSGQEPPFAHDPWSWVTVFGRQVPIMVLPYVGAIRDYLVLLPFAAFGPNYYTARIPTALVGAFGIWGLSVLLRDRIGPRAAAIVALALSIHPAYLALTVYDKGVAEWIAPFGALSLALAFYLEGACGPARLLAWRCHGIRRLEQGERRLAAGVRGVGGLPCPREANVCPGAPVRRSSGGRSRRRRAPALVRDPVPMAPPSPSCGRWPIQRLFPAWLCIASTCCPDLSLRSRGHMESPANANLAGRNFLSDRRHLALCVPAER